MSKHTSGPWKFGKESSFGVHNPSIVYAGDEAIAQVYGIALNTRLEDLTSERWQAGLANARLIAAAPDLLEALRDMLKHGDVGDRARAVLALKKATQS